MNDIWEFRFGENAWYQIFIEGAHPEPRSNHTIVVNEESGEIILFGGGGLHKSRYGEVWLLDLIMKRWVLVQCEGTYPSERTYHSACIGKEHMFVFGGESGSDLSDLHVLSLKDKRW